MRSLFKKVGIAALAALSLVGATLAVSSTTQATTLTATCSTSCAT